MARRIICPSSDRSPLSPGHDKWLGNTNRIVGSRVILFYSDRIEPCPIHQAWTLSSPRHGAVGWCGCSGRSVPIAPATSINTAASPQDTQPNQPQRARCVWPESSHYPCTTLHELFLVCCFLSC